MNDNSQVLDLDALAPEKKTVKLNGKTYEVNPCTLDDFIAIQKILLSFDRKDVPVEQQIAEMEKIKEVLRPFIPDIDNMRLTISQLFALLQFAYKASVPADMISTTQEKKIENSATLSPIS